MNTASSHSQDSLSLSISMSTVKIKTVFCLLIITLFTSFFFARSVQVREPWIVPTFLHVYTALEHKQHITAMNLAYVNNWLKESPFQLSLGKYMYPASVEMPTLDKRNFNPPTPPGVVAQLYLLFKFLDVTGLIPNIYEQRGTQLLLVILYNFMLHFLLALVMCWLVFFVCCKLGFDRLNSTLLGIVPAIILFHNAGNLYWFHLIYSASTAIVPLFALYIFLELLRTESTSPHISRIVQIIQPIVMFTGVFTSWLFVFVILTVYVTRIVRKEIILLASLRHSLSWIKQSFVFFFPSLVAIGIWIYSIIYYQRHIIKANILEAPISSFGLTFTDNLLRKVGILKFHGELSGIDDFVIYFTKALYTHLSHDYGITAVLMLYAVFYMATRGREFMAGNNNNLAAITYIMLFVPCLLHTLFLVADDANNHFVSLRYSPALSLSFVFAPIFILQMLKKSHLMAAIQLTNSRQITVVTLVGISSSVLYTYAQIYNYNEQPVTKMFTPPAYQHVAVGEFVRKNTKYHDVVFSEDYYLVNRPFLIEAHFTNKIIHFANNLDIVYHKAKSIKKDFTIKVFYHEKRQKEIAQLAKFLALHNIAVDSQGGEIGGLLAFNGKKFRSWYEQAHECNKFPQRCKSEG